MTSSRLVVWSGTRLCEASWLRPEREALERLEPITQPLRRRQRQVAQRALTLLTQLDAVEAVPGLPSVATAARRWREDLHQLSHEIGDPVSLQGLTTSTALDVAFVGRTEAGKSTLINALLGYRVADIGAGRQRTTRTVLPYQLSPRVSIWDTPGIAAMDGAEDELIAESAVQRAGFVVYVVSSDQLGGHEAGVLERFDRFGRPCMLVLNFKLDIDGRQKNRDLKARRRRFLNDPSSVFVAEDLAAHASRIEAAAPNTWRRAGGKVVPIHALAGLIATEPNFTNEAESLKVASRVASVQDFLERLAIERAPAARIVVNTQPFIHSLGLAGERSAALSEELAHTESELRAAIETAKTRIDAVVTEHKTRFRFRVDELLTEVRADIPDLVASKDPSRIRRRWERRLSSLELEDEFAKALDALAAELSRALAAPVSHKGEVLIELPRFQFDSSIDLGSIIAEAVLEGLKNAGTSGFVKFAAKKLMPRGAAGAPGGPLAVILALLFEVAVVGRRILHGKRRAERLLQQELTAVLRAVIDETSRSLPELFRKRVLKGNIGQEISAHRYRLQAAVEAIVDVQARLDELSIVRTDLAERWVRSQLEMIERVYAGHLGQIRVQRRRGTNWVEQSPTTTVPWAAMALLEQLGGEPLHLLEHGQREGQR